MKRLVVALALGAAVLSGTAISAQTVSGEDALKATHALLMKSVSSGNVALIGSVVHPRALGFFRDSQTLVQLGPKVTVMDIAPNILLDLSQFTSSIATTTVFRVAGDVGLVALTSQADAKSSEKKDLHQRSTFMYVNTPDGWKLVAWHTSDTPPLKK